MAPELRTKQQLADAARVLATSYELVQREAVTFIPVDWQSYSPDPPPGPGQRVWIPFRAEQKRRLANVKAKILFASDAEFRSFDFMLRQLALHNVRTAPGILIRTEAGIVLLDETGQLVEHDGTFTPNFVRPLLNEDPTDKETLRALIAEWVGGDENARSLLHHLATSLAPSYSAVKYVILLGEGRNGKSTLLTMLAMLFGQDNVSNVTRQMMAERSPTVAELNDKLLNVIFDGEMSYIKDSSMEKTLIAGEPGVVRMLYESGTTRVQTNALFLEALNLEPKARDKSSALQKRLVRFHFPNVYAENKAFFREMTSERMLGALLSLLIDHFVPEEDIAAKLIPTKTSLSLQAEQAWTGSPVLQYIEFLHNTDPTAVARLESGSFPLETFFASFKPWMQSQGAAERSDGDLLSMVRNSFVLGWVVENGVRKRHITGVKPEVTFIINTLKGEPNDHDDP